MFALWLALALTDWQKFTIREDRSLEPFAAGLPFGGCRSESRFSVVRDCDDFGVLDGFIGWRMLTHVRKQSLRLFQQMPLAAVTAQAEPDSMLASLMHPFSSASDHRRSINKVYF